MWEEELSERLKIISCQSCGSRKVTKAIQGRPYQPYVDWAQAKCKELGWQAVKFAGCTAPGGLECCDCGQEAIGSWGKSAIQPSDEDNALDDEDTAADAVQTWTQEEAAMWEEELSERLKIISCQSCGSRKVTKAIQGRPYQPYVDWAQAKCKELGWQAVKFAGCTAPGGLECCDCGQEAIR